MLSHFFISEPSTIKDIVSSEEFPLSFGISDQLWPLAKVAGYCTLACLAIVILIIVLWAGIRPLRKHISSVKLQSLFIAALACNFIIYDIGMCTGNGWSLLGNAPMAVIHAFEAFLLNSDVSAIHSPFHSNWIYMTLFSLGHAFAAIVSTLFIIKHFGYNLISRLKMWRVSRSKTRVNHTYIFWDFNDVSKDLCKSIYEHYDEQKNTDYRIIVIRTNAVDDEADSHIGIDRVFEFFSLKSNEIDLLRKYGCYTTSTYVNPANVEDRVEAANGSILHLVLHLRSLSRLIANSSGHLDIMFLGNNERENIQAAELLLGDTAIQSFATRGGKVVFHCRARRNSIHRAIEDSRAGQGIVLKIEDSSHDSVENLKKNTDMLPVNCVDVEADATVSSSFNALVVGFGEVGCDAVRFLYEYGSFVDSRSTPDDVRRAPLHIDAVDSKMADLAGTFIVNTPGVPVSMPFLKDGSGINSGAPITLESLDCRSAEFYLKLEKKLSSMNYIVIATADDEQNISLAIRILKLAIRVGVDFTKFRMAVRIKNDTNNYIRRITDHYNRMTAAQVALDSEKDPIPRDAEIKLPIYLFGSDEEVFTYDNIISDVPEKSARNFCNHYADSINEELIEGLDAWDTAFQKRMRLHGDFNKTYPPYQEVMALRRTRGQDFANSAHALTKQKLADAALKALNREFDWGTISRKTLTTVYPDVTDDIAAILTNLARTEHLRWNASHEILGYTHGEKKDEARMLHDCLVAWQKLLTKTQAYDYNVVDVSLGINIIH